MTQEDIIRITRELYGTGATEQEIRFAILVAAAQREKIAAWMWNMGYATRHGDTIEDLLDHLGTQIAERLEAETIAERQRCAQIAREFDREQPNTNYGGYIARLIEETAP
jgi:hypothetical protein